MTRPHLLYVAFWFPPSRASGVYRALATAQVFQNEGWDVTVVTTSKEFLLDEVGSVDESLMSEVPQDISVLRIDGGLHWPGTSTPHFRGWVKRAFPRTWASLRTLRNELLAWLSKPTSSSGFDEKYAGWIQPAVSAALELISTKGIDHILATGNPYSAFEVAFKVSELTGAPFSVDFRDPWTIDVFSANRAALSASNFEAESRIVEAAAACIHVNQQIADAYKAIYPFAADRQFVVENGFDRRSVDFPIVPYTGGPMKVGMLGTVNDRWPLAGIFTAWSRSRQAFPDGSELILGGYLGYFSKSAEPIESTLPGDSSGFRYVGPVPKGSVADFYRSLDVVLVPVPGGGLVTSGKIYEALALGIPVVCIQSEEGAARRFTDESAVGFSASPDADEISRALLAAMNARKELTESQIRTNRELMAGYERSRIIRRVVGIVENATYV